MSLDDITLNTRVYTATQMAGTRVVRTNLSSTGTYPGILEMSHATGAGNKPNRHLLRVSGNVNISDTDYPTGLHVVITAPKGAVAADIQPMVDDLVDQLAVSGFVARFLAGGFD